MSLLSIFSNRVITPAGLVKASVLIEDGKIVDVIEGKLETGPGTIDLGDDVLMPGVIDPHVHINEPGRTDWEGFDTATKAAIAGGITTLVDMPLNSSPVTTTAKSLDQKLRSTNKQLHAHCGFWGGIVPGNTREIQPLVDKGVLGFKAFLTHSGIDEFPNVTEEDLRKAMPLIAKNDLPLLVHCELTEANESNAEIRSSYQKYLASRPAYWEDDAIALMIRLCEEFDCRVHIVHLSSADSITQIARAKQKGLPLTVETAQHYLYFAAENIPDGHTEFKCAPPIRGRDNNEKLWLALKDGIIDFVATDHSPAPAALKETGSGDLGKAWGGISSIQFALPVLWTAASARGCELLDVMKWLCEHPANFTGLSNKGRIEKGCDADIVAWDPEQSFLVTADKIIHRHKLTPYLGQHLKGVVKRTWLSGENVFNQGQFFLNKGSLILG